MGLTLLDKIWNRHALRERADGETLLYIDRILLHERTGAIALESLEQAGRVVRAPGQALVCVDHIVDTLPGRSEDTLMPGGGAFIRASRRAASHAGIAFIDIDDPRQGIVHVISPELGIAQPGMTLVCPDSHTCTQGALGLLAWGVGSTECEHALATQTLVVRKPKAMKVVFDGVLAAGVGAKDLMLHLIATRGANGGAGHAVEFSGSVVEEFGVEARMTLCNMAVEFAAWSALCAPDAKTAAFLEGRPFAPAGRDRQAAMEDWKRLRADDDAVYDAVIHIDAGLVTPMVTWGTSPAQAIAVGGRAPTDLGADRPADLNAGRARDYMAVEAGQELGDLTIDCAFIGSCTNSRLSDLRDAAEVLRGRHVAPGVRAICVPGSMSVKVAAEAEGLDQVFRDAGFEWREAGCSMCFFAGGEHFAPKSRVVTSTNRNFENRQGPGVRSHLASPSTVAASAILGRIAAAGELVS